MTSLQILNAPNVFVEISQSTLTVLDGDDALELSLERVENGRLSAHCIERLKESLRVFLKKHSWRSGVRAYCGINARGVSLRRITLPPCSKDELERLVAMQIEREFPLPPAELAWGYRVLKAGTNGGSKPAQEVLVAAIKRDVLEDYWALLRGCGVDPVFTLSALARGALCAESSGTYALLDIGQQQSEVIFFNEGAPSALRVLPWGGENVTRAIEQAAGLDRTEAEKLKVRLDENAAVNGEMSSAIQPAIDQEFSALAKSLPANSIGEKLYLSGPTARLRNLPQRLAEGIQVACERLELDGNGSHSAAILGLRKSIEHNDAAPPLVFQLGAEAGTKRAARYPTWKWAALAVFLAVTAFALRYAELLVNQPRLARRLTSMKAYRENLPTIERELVFLQYLKTNQPVYVDAISVIANATGGGTRIDSLTMGRSGDVSLRATMRDAQQVTDFRTKLIGSGFFSNVVVEEQSPSAQDKQKLAVRIAGKWKLGSELPATPAEKAKPPPTAPAKAATPKKEPS